MKNSFLRPSRSVSQPKNTRAQHRAGQIGAAGKPDIGAGELENGTLLQGAGDGARQSHLQPVEDPGDAERNDYQSVEPAPWQAVEACGNIGLDDARRADGRGHALGTQYV